MRIFLKFLLVFFTGFLAWAYQAACPPAPNKVGPPDGLPVTSPRIKLRDRRYLSYKEFGVPKESAKYKIIYVHGFDSFKHYALIATSASPGFILFHLIDRVMERVIRILNGRLALDTEELADQLELGSKFYVVGFSMGGQVIWSYLKYIPHRCDENRLAGAALIAPVVNYWWPKLPSNLSQQAFSKQLLQDQWSLRVAHYLPSLTYWWNTQKWFPILTWMTNSQDILSCQDRELVPIFTAGRSAVEGQVRQQGEYESIHRDLNIGFGTWAFDPTEIENPFPENEGSVDIWMGDEDMYVPVTLQRYIAQQLPWINLSRAHGCGPLVPLC
ncbi:putative alpha/Beta hydrolase [Helianthus debilis subsp. tardiflorus]